MSETENDPPAPSAEDLKAAHAVATAATEAAQKGEGEQGVKDAAREEAKRQGISDEEADRIAEKLAPKLADWFDRFGAFSEQESAPAPATPAAAAPPVVAQEQAADHAAEAPQPPRKLSWAERHFGDA